MAREVLEAIDGRGRYYTTAGAAADDWWSAASLQAAAERERCFADQRGRGDGVAGYSVSDLIGQASALRSASSCLALVCSVVRWAQWWVFASRRR